MGFIEAAQQKKRFKVRDENEIAVSRACVLTDVEWLNDVEKWKVHVDFVD